jgi:hypothetical protein
VTPSVIISAFLNGEIHKISLVKTGSTSLSAEHKVWKIGSNANGPPDSDDTYALTQCVASADGKILAGQGPFWSKVKVTFVETPVGVDSADLNVSAMIMSSDQNGRISPSDCAAGIAFVKQCNFPLAN